MKIQTIDIVSQRIPLTRPYTVAYETKDAIDILLVRLETDSGHVGYGSASPSRAVTGEVFEEALGALTDGRLSVLRGRDPRAVGTRSAELVALLPGLPAAQALLELALWDLVGKALEVPLVRLLGAVHQGLPTSVTIGIQGIDATLADAREHLAQGFCCLKIKIGHEVDQDIELLHRLRESLGSEVRLRVDANQGYTSRSLQRFWKATQHLDLELLEQPFPPTENAALRALDPSLRAEIAADESVHGPLDAWRLAQGPAVGTFNIKLMKCGGLTAARRIADIAHHAGLGLMWGCMDESRISIVAALHLAYASPATRYLDLDGSFDLSSDVATGGFDVRDGCLFLGDKPGLGVDVRWPDADS